MSQSYWERQWQIQITTVGGQQFTIPDPSHATPVRVTFSINKKVLSLAQTAEITLYNLNPTTETEILKNGYQVTISAGYQGGGYGTLFTGLIRQPIRGKEDPVTYFLKLLCFDGMEALGLGFCNFTVGAGQTFRSLAQMVARQSSVPFELLIDSSIPNTPPSPRGATIHGKTGEILQNLAQPNHANVYANNGKVSLSYQFKPPSGNIPTLNAQTGLIGMPEQQDNGVHLRTLINPAFELDTWVHLNNQDIILAELEIGNIPSSGLIDRDGLYRIIEWTATGDTRGTDWYLDLNTISQAGALPDMLADPNQVLQ